MEDPFARERYGRHRRARKQHAHGIGEKKPLVGHAQHECAQPARICAAAGKRYGDEERNTYRAPPFNVGMNPPL